MYRRVSSLVVRAIKNMTIDLETSNGEGVHVQGLVFFCDEQFFAVEHCMVTFSCNGLEPFSLRALCV